MDTNTQPTIWEVPDDVWTMIEPILTACYPAKPKGHRRVELLRVLNGIIFRLHTGRQWHQLPKRFSYDSTVHRHFQHWCQCGILVRLWAVLVEVWARWAGSTGRGQPLTPPWEKPGGGATC